jgi:hypothetical protein
MAARMPRAALGTRRDAHGVRGAPVKEVRRLRTSCIAAKGLRREALGARGDATRELRHQRTSCIAALRGWRAARGQAGGDGCPVSCVTGREARRGVPGPVPP